MLPSLGAVKKFSCDAAELVAAAVAAAAVDLANQHLFVPSKVREDISARNPGYIQAALTETRRVLKELVLEPLKEEQYYEEDDVEGSMQTR